MKTKYNKIVIALIASTIVAIGGMVTMAIAMPATDKTMLQALIGAGVMLAGMVAMGIASALLMVYWDGEEGLL